jgi:membrane-bound lytic murein transglycosylase B
MIVRSFTPMGRIQVQRALCVAYRESHYDPNAENPYTGAAGVFQFMPSVWPNLSRAAGWGGHSAFEAQANVGTAAWTVAHYGWSPWQGDGRYCGF